MPENSILVVGSLNMDQVVRVPRVPVLGETLLGAGSLELVPGGKGANQAVAMARLGAAVTMAGRVGRDAFGQQLQGSLRADSVDTALIVVDQEETSGTAFIFLTPGGDNAIVVAAGANMRVGHDADQVARIIRALPSFQALVLQMEIPLETVKTLTAAAHAAAVPVILNAAPAGPLPGETLKQLAVLIVNETEAVTVATSLPNSGAAAQPIQRIDSVEDARLVAAALHEYGIATVVITLGAQGAVLVTSDEAGKARSLHQPAPAVSVVDTTAAGDCFVGALTVALSAGDAPESALRFAVYASALKVTRFGAQSGLPARAEVAEFLRQRGMQG
ncbi:MAG: ribokinase [Chloroflexota bacterium]|nr:ribokinase [Chloroflexota bacterium]